MICMVVTISRKNDGNVMIVRRFEWGLILGGLVFFLMGLFVMTIPIWGSEGQVATTGEILILGFLFPTLPGAIMLFMRWEIVIDKGERTVTSWWGILVPFKKTVRPFDEFDMVTIEKEWIQPSSDGGGGGG